MKNLSFVMTISHNIVSNSISVMSIPSTMTIELDEQKTKVYNEVKKFNPNIVYIWAQQIWNMNYPNTFGKVIDVKIIN
jgi:hypothetical protein